jgi:hypothetical protein
MITFVMGQQKKLKGNQVKKFGNPMFGSNICRIPSTGKGIQNLPQPLNQIAKLI